MTVLHSVLSEREREREREKEGRREGGRKGGGWEREKEWKSISLQSLSKGNCGSTLLNDNIIVVGCQLHVPCTARNSYKR